MLTRWEKLGGAGQRDARQASSESLLRMIPTMLTLVHFRIGFLVA